MLRAGARRAPPPVRPPSPSRLNSRPTRFKKVSFQRNLLHKCAYITRMIKLCSSRQKHFVRKGWFETRVLRAGAHQVCPTSSQTKLFPSKLSAQFGHSSNSQSICVVTRLRLWSETTFQGCLPNEIYCTKVLCITGMAELCSKFR